MRAWELPRPPLSGEAAGCPLHEPRREGVHQAECPRGQVWPDGPASRAGRSRYAHGAGARRLPWPPVWPPCGFIGVAVDNESPRVSGPPAGPCGRVLRRLMTPVPGPRPTPTASLLPQLAWTPPDMGGHEDQVAATTPARVHLCPSMSTHVHFRAPMLRPFAMRRSGVRAPSSPPP